MMIILPVWLFSAPVMGADTRHRQEAGVENDRTRSDISGHRDKSGDPGAVSSGQLRKQIDELLIK